MKSGQKEGSNNYVFHYCSLNAFLNIVSRGKIRFSDLTKTNDADEIRYLYKLYREYLKKNNTKRSANGFSWEEFSSCIIHHHYSLSFSRKGDDAQLWLSYANPGVSIGFDADELLKYFNLIKPNGFNFSSGDVSYIDINDLGEIGKFFKYCMNFDFKNKTFEEIASFTENFSIGSPLIKNKGWAEEKEFRIYFKTKSPSYSHIKKHYDFPREYEIKKNCLVPFFDIPISKTLIKKIYFSYNSKFSNEDIYSFLIDNGFKIERSDITKSSVSIK